MNDHVQPSKARLGDLTTLISSGVTPKGGSEVYLLDGPAMLIRSQNVLINSLSIEDVAYIDEATDASMVRTRVQCGDVLLNITGASIGRAAAFKLRGVRANVNQHVCIIRPRQDRLDQGYLTYLITSPPFQANIDRLQRGGTRQALTFGQIANFEIPLPPLDKQRRIAAILDAANELRVKRRAAQDRLDKLGQSIFIDMFGDPEKNPKRWPQFELSELVRDDDGINYGVVQPGDEFEGGVPLIRVGDLFGGRVRRSGLKRIDPAIERAYVRSRLRGDEILVSCVGSIGTVALADKQMMGHNIARAVARIPLSARAHRVYIAEYLRSGPVQRYFTKELRTVSQPTLNIKQLAETEILVPPIEMQAQFAERVAAIHCTSEKLGRSKDQLDALFGSLQLRAFRGEL